MNKEEYIDAINNYWLGECGGENVGLNSEECSTILSFMKEAEYTYGDTKDMSEEEAQESGYCFMKLSSFFKADQVEKI